MRALGLDVGKKRIGLALSDPLGTFAYAKGTLNRTSLGKDLAQIAVLVAEEAVDLVVLGLPRSMNGTLGPQAETVQKFGAALAARVTIPIEYWDERLSTVAAGRALRALGLSGQRIRQEVDSAAATLILQAYLDHGRNLRGRADAEGDRADDGR